MKSSQAGSNSGTGPAGSARAPRWTFKGRGFCLLLGALLLCACPEKDEQSADPSPTPKAGGAAEATQSAGGTEQGGGGSTGDCSSAKLKVSGKITKDTRWCGDVEVTAHVLVTPEATLTIAPGTRVHFKPYREKMRPDRRIILRVEGQLQATGTADKRILFTSGHGQPINGDWHGVELIQADGSHLEHAVFEYAEIGLEIWQSDVMLRHVVARFNNWQGISINHKSKVVLAGSRIYANGYNCIDARGKSTLHMTSSYIARCRLLGIHVGSSTAHLEENLFEGHTEGVYISKGSTVDLIANSFSAQKGCSVSCDAGVLLRRANNNFAGDPEANSLCCQEGKVTKVEAENEPPAIFRSGVREGLSSYIDYIPGQVNLDPFPYLLPDKSETRMVDKKIGAGLWMTWAIAWDEPYLWVADLEGKVSRLDSQSGEVLQSFQTTLSEPWGMTVFQGMLWINDYNKQAIFLIDPKSGKVRKRIPSPDPADGCRGMADNGKEVYLLGYATPRIYVLSAEGKLLDQFPAPSVAPWPGAAVKDPVRGGLAWDGESFWAPVGRLVRFNREGKLLDWIHGTGSEIMGLAWDGDHLWTTPRLNEAWKETPRFYRVNILKAAQFASAK